MTNDNGLPATPLEGIRMLDLGRYQAGPRCALMFARMGAEVIKIEGLSGDESRASGPRVRGQSAYWVQYNSGKKTLSINLRTEEGKEVLRDLVKVSDILLQNFRPGTIEKMGFGYDVLQELNPRIVMINVSAYGQYGPYSERVGFDQVGQALGGLMWMTGFPDDPPIKTYFPLIDRITSLHATIGALAALLGAALGTLIGLISGYFGGAVDAVLMRLTDIEQTAGSVRYTVEASYVLVLNHRSTELPNTLQGRVAWSIEKGQDGLWYIATWTDNSIGAAASWSDLKAAFIK